VSPTYFLSKQPPSLRILIGLILLSGGGLIYSAFGSIGKPIALLLITIGTTFMLQASCAFQVNSNSHFIAVIGASALLMILVDFWPIQLGYAQAVNTVLQVIGISPTQISIPYFSGLQILLFVQEAGSGRIIGGEIDNACAGLIVVVPALLLLWLANRKIPQYPDTVMVGVLAICIIVVGNFGRIAFELWAPAVGLAPFEIVHYPLAYILGICGLGAIIWIGHHLRRPEQKPK
jgi:exosortase/archaeosortase family protein